MYQLRLGINGRISQKTAKGRCLFLRRSNNHLEPIRKGKDRSVTIARKTLTPKSASNAIFARNSPARTTETPPLFQIHDIQLPPVT
ncbi:hypothetical protein HHI36_015219 [Cryptolaemus montrouzieri]|uniref:Uncharacterized protein n=1 Tax=Cryptolaemus montrouzieri TaxID=559131 RepID=A0ABD2N6E7_9CUCU